jgi:CheY-like chemotaxis protein
MAPDPTSPRAVILVVDDDPTIRDVLEMVLTDEGYRVLLAANGRQGLERLAEGPRPDLVISDYMMPVLDGPGLIKAMQNSAAQRDIPFIIMSSMPEVNVRERIAGYAGFVRKPFQLAAVVRLVTSILNTPQDRVLKRNPVAP